MIPRTWEILSLHHVRFTIQSGICKRRTSEGISQHLWRRSTQRIAGLKRLVFEQNIVASLRARDSLAPAPWVALMRDFLLREPLSGSSSVKHVCQAVLDDRLIPPPPVSLDEAASARDLRYRRGLKLYRALESILRPLRTSNKQDVGNRGILDDGISACYGPSGANGGESKAVRESARGSGNVCDFARGLMCCLRIDNGPVRRRFRQRHLGTAGGGVWESYLRGMRLCFFPLEKGRVDNGARYWIGNQLVERVWYIR